MNIILIDNVDSFSFNLVDEVRALGFSMQIFRNTVSASTVIDALEQSLNRQATLLMLSPGPGAPSQAGCMPRVISAMAGRVPMLGICLGHQAIVEYAGGKVSRAPSVMHGKASYMQIATSVEAEKLFTDLDKPLSIARYHSLVATSVPACLEVLASIDDLPMAVYHSRHNMLGFQFHPESILTCNGSQLLKQSIEFLLAKEI